MHSHQTEATGRGSATRSTCSVCCHDIRSRFRYESAIFSYLLLRITANNLATGTFVSWFCIVRKWLKIRSRWFFFAKTIGLTAAFVFTARSSYASAVLGIVILPVVCPSICLSVTRVLCDETVEHTADILISHERVIILVFWYRQRLVGDAPFHLKFALELTHPLSEKRRLQLISAYNVWIVRASETCSIIANRKSTTRFPTSYRGSAYVQKRICRFCE